MLALPAVHSIVPAAVARVGPVGALGFPVGYRLLLAAFLLANS